MSAVVANPSIEQIWKILDQVPDPEIPVISLVELGVIRAVSWREDTLVIAVSPTYSGCPATSMINLDIEVALRANGIEKIQLQRQLSPPWTSDWISAAAHEKLRRFGIAPPSRSSQAEGADAAPIPCPHCDSSNTRLVSAFGSTPCKASHVCDACLEPFEHFKCI